MKYILAVVLIVYISRTNSLPKNERFNVGAEGINAKDSITILKQSTFLPQAHSNYWVKNIGKVPVLAELLYGTEAQWSGVVVSHTVKPGRTQVLSNLNSDYYVTSLRLINKDNATRAIVIARTASGTTTVTSKESNFDVPIDINDFAKHHVALVADMIPFVGSTLSYLIGYFWPSSAAPDVWEQLKARVGNLIDSKLSGALESLLDSSLRRLKKKVRSLDVSLKQGITGTNITDHYMNVAQDLIGLEEAFIFTSKSGFDAGKMNYASLPIYCTIVTMKLLFYKAGILNRTQYGINDAQLTQLKLYALEMLVDVEPHLNSVLQERLRFTYQNCHPENIYAQLTTVRSFVAINGFEYLPLWRQWVEEPKSKADPYRDALIYSPYFGKSSIELLEQASNGTMGKTLCPAHYPELVNGKEMMVRNKLIEVRVHYSESRINALTVRFAHGSRINMGRFGKKTENIIFEDKYLVKLVAHGEDTVSGLSLHFSDGSSKKFGKMDAKNQNVFELKDHHIAGIFIGSDIKNKKNIVDNIAVSYLKDNVNHI